MSRHKDNDGEEYGPEKRPLNRASIGLEGPLSSRRLAAIMFTDIVGYSAMTQANEEHALALLRHHNKVVRSIYPRHEGREVKTIGDAFLLEFPSALNAVRCAVAIQEAFHFRNEREPTNKMSLRIGVHVGDVVLTDGDVFGDGVNIAARIQPLAEPGGICISEDAARQVQNKIPCPMVRIGNGDLKNIKLPVGIYKVFMPWEDVPKWYAHVWKKLSRRSFLAWTGAIFCVLLYGAMWVVFTRNPVKWVPSDYVIVSFTNRTNHGVLDHSIETAIRVALRQSPQINLLPADRIKRRLSLMKKSADESLSTRVAIDVARSEGAGIVVASQIAPFGEGYLLSMEVIDAATGEAVRWFRREIRELDGILDAVEDMCDDVRLDLGESLADSARNFKALQQVTTSSLEALELYSQGEKMEVLGKYAESAILKGMAVAKDTSFTMAVSDLAYIYEKIGRDSLARYYHSRILPLIDRVSDREKLYILANYYNSRFELDLPKAYLNVQQLVLRYPNSAESWGTFGHYAMTVGDTKVALDANERAVALDSFYAGPCFNNSGFALALAGRSAEAWRFYEMSKAIRPEFLNIDIYMGQLHWIEGNLDAAEGKFRAVALSATYSLKQVAHIFLASLYRFKGQIARATKEAETALELDKSFKRAGDRAYIHYLLAELAYAGGKTDSYHQHMKNAIYHCGSRYNELGLVGASYAEKGFVSEADAIMQRLDELAKNEDRTPIQHAAWIHLIKGRLLTFKEPAKALIEFAVVQQSYAGDPVFLLCQKDKARCLAQMRDTAYIEVYERLLGRKGEIVMAYVLGHSGGFWTAELWPETHIAFAEALIAANNSREAVAQLKRVEALWAVADGSFRGVRELRKLVKQSKTIR